MTTPGNIRVLVIDDESIMREFVAETLVRAGYDVETAGNGKEGLAKFQNEVYDLVLTDLKMPDLNGLEVVREVRHIAPATSVIVMTAYGTIDTAVEAMRLGAFDYVTKPLSPDVVELVVERALEHARLTEEVQYLRQEASERFSFGRMVGESSPMDHVYRQIAKVASSSTRVLVTGESGTGKELVARAIHEKSQRSGGPFIRVNCAALSESLLESELFGHERGAFTGAHRRRLGRFELADGGTLLLDEIGEMAPSLQAKLLRVVQEGEIDRVGGSRPVSIDARLICTTNRDLEQEVANGNFRRDLFFRLNVVPIKLPPLRERKEDIPALVDHFIAMFSARIGKTISGIDDDVLEMFAEHTWPGNVRELENYIERAIVLADSDRLRRTDFSFTWLATDHADEDGSFIKMPIGSTVAEIERELIFKTLEANDNNRTQTARVLGISIRTLRNKLAIYAKDAE